MKTLPPEVERRRRRVTRALPLIIIAVIAFALGARAGVPGSPEMDAAERYTAAWAQRNYEAMYRELNAASRRSTTEADFAKAFRRAAEVATLRSIKPGSPGDAVDMDDVKTVPVAVEATTAAFGRSVATVELRYSEGGIAWAPHLVFPGLARGEHLANRVELAPRAPILAVDGTALARGPAGQREYPIGSAAIDITGEMGLAEKEELPVLARRGFPPDTPVGVSGLERALNARLAGRPGGLLLAAARTGDTARLLAKSTPRGGAPVKTTIDIDLQLAAVSALAGRAGGVAVLDTRNGDVRALAGQAFSAPQPPGSTFKVVTTVAALQKGVVSLDDEFPILNGINVGGRFISNANGEYCGGTFREAFAESCNADFAPLGPKIGNAALVATATRFGFNSRPALYAQRFVEEADPPQSTIPTEIGDALDLGVSAIGQGEVLATPLQMATVAQTIANGGVRMPSSVVANRRLRPEAKPTRVVSRKVAAEVAELMVGVVAGGTGFAAAIPEAQVAGKTGTAELGPRPDQEGEEEPEQIKDAWFIAFAPAEKPRLSVGVLLIEAEAAGGEVAAPVAAQVLSAGL